MSDYKEILTSDRVYKKYKSIIPDTNVSIDDIGPMSRFSTS